MKISSGANFGRSKEMDRSVHRARTDVCSDECVPVQFRRSRRGARATACPSLPQTTPLAENDTAAHSLPRARRQSTSGARSGTAEHAARLAGGRGALTERERITEI